MKKLLALLLALMMLFSVATVFAGCEDSGSKKKSSSSKKDDDEDEDDEDEDEDEDEDNGDKDEDEDKDKDGDGDEDDKDNNEDDENDKPEPTEPKPTKPEPTEPEPTEAGREELMSKPDVAYDDSRDNIYVCAYILSGSDYKYFEVAKQKLADGEGILYYYDETEEFIMHISGNTMDMFVAADGEMVPDTQTDDQTKLTKAQSVAYILNMFIDIPSMMGNDVGYKRIDDHNNFAVYEAYKDGELIRTIYIDTETGVTAYIVNENGQDLMWIENLYFEFDFSGYI